MAVYRPSYKDPKTGKLKQSSIWWYGFSFAGRRVQESSKSTRKTIAVEAEKRRRLELEKGFNQIEDRRERIRSIDDLAKEFLESYRLRHPRSVTFAEYALGHVQRILGRTMTVDLTEDTVTRYQTIRLKEKASPKSINDETGFILRLVGERGDFIRAKLRRRGTLKLTVPPSTTRAYSEEEKTAMLAAAKARRSPSIYPALVLALNAGMRDAEIRNLQWGRVDLKRQIVTVGKSKTDAGAGRTIPLNADSRAALVEHAKWYLDKFGQLRPEWYVFPAGKPQPIDPTKPPTSFKTVWAAVKEAAGVEGRWHDNRHTFITALAESGEASDETIRDLAGHVSKRMLKHYSHIRMEAKRRAVSALGAKEKGSTLVETLAGTNDNAYQEGTFDATSKQKANA